MIRETLALNLLALGVCLAGCSGSTVAQSPSGGPSTTSTAPVSPHACDPLTGAETPIALANVLGAGRHPDGTLYVVDDGGRDHERAFISSADGLHRVIVAGSGATGASLTLSIENPELTIRIEQPGAHPTRMGVVRGKLDGRTFEVGTTGDELAIVGPEALAGLAVKNVPGNVVVEYDGSLADGRRFFVARPEVDWTYEDFRVFFGVPAEMVERPLVRASRGSTTFITFTVEGVEYDAVIPSAALGDPTPPKITPAGQSPIALTLLSSDSAAHADLKFICTK